MKNLTVESREKSSGVFLITLAGPLDSYTHETLDFYMEKVIAPNTLSIVFDMSKVDYISSMGVGSIFKIRKAAKDNDFEFKMVGLQAPVQKVLTTVQAMPAEGLFQSIEEMDEYLDSLQRKA